MIAPLISLYPNKTLAATATSQKERKKQNSPYFKIPRNTLIGNLKKKDLFHLAFLKDWVRYLRTESIRCDSPPFSIYFLKPKIWTFFIYYPSFIYFLSSIILWNGIYFLFLFSDNDLSIRTNRILAVSNENNGFHLLFIYA